MTSHGASQPATMSHAACRMPHSLAGMEFNFSHALKRPQTPCLCVNAYECLHYISSMPFWATGQWRAHTTQLCRWFYLYCIGLLKCNNRRKQSHIRLRNDCAICTRPNEHSHKHKHKHLGLCPSRNWNTHTINDVDSGRRILIYWHRHLTQKKTRRWAIWKKGRWRRNTLEDILHISLISTISTPFCGNKFAQVRWKLEKVWNSKNQF